jgi:tetratricopeptide (TPR) repeat protein
MNLERLAAAMGLRDSGRVEEAAIEFGLMAAEIDDPEWKSNMLMSELGCYCMLGRLVEAERVLQAMRPIKTDNIAVEMNKAFAEACFLAQKGELELGIQAFDLMLSRFSAHFTALEFRYLYEDIQQRRGAVLAKLGRYDQSISILEEALSFDLEPQTKSDVLSNLGLCYSQLKRYGDAKDSFLRALELGVTKEWEGQVHVSLGIAYAHLGLLREAKRELQICEQRAAEYQLQMGPIYGWLRNVCQRLGEKAEAEQYARLSRPQ